VPRVEHLLTGGRQMVLDASPMARPALDQALRHEPVRERAERLLTLERRRGQSTG
jgi:hypothetical protein